VHLQVGPQGKEQLRCCWHAQAPALVSRSKGSITAPWQHSTQTSNDCMQATCPNAGFLCTLPGPVPCTPRCKNLIGPRCCRHLLHEMHGLPNLMPDSTLPYTEKWDLDWGRTTRMCLVQAQRWHQLLREKSL